MINLEEAFELIWVCWRGTSYWRCWEFFFIVSFNCNFDLNWSFINFWQGIFVFSAVQGLPKTIFEVIKWWREKFRLNKADKNVIYPNAVQITIWLRTKTEFSLELPLIKLNFSNFQTSLFVSTRKKSFNGNHYVTHIQYFISQQLTRFLELMEMENSL